MNENPIRELRLLTGVSQTDFATLAGVSRQTVVNLEAGMYEEIPMAVHRKLSELVRERDVVPERVLRGRPLLDVYREWQAAKRAQTDLTTWPVLSLQEIVDRFSTPGTFCRLLCIPTTALHHGLTRHGVPRVIATALQEAGYRYADWEIE